MLRPPRNTDAQLLDSVSLRFIIETGFAKAFMGVALVMVLPQIGYSLEASRTSVFLYESMAQLVFAYPARRLGVGPASNAVLHWAGWPRLGPSVGNGSGAGA
jgi:Ca2+-transporting ATPase